MSDAPADTAATPDAPAPEVEVNVVTDTVDHAAEAEKWKALARKHEDKAKANQKAAKELEDLRLSSMDETQKAVELARSEGRTEALREAGTRLVAAEVRVAAAGSSVDVDALLEGLDATKFLDEEGEPDRDLIAAWVEKVAPKVEVPDDGNLPFPDLGQGFRVPADQQLGNDALTKALEKLVL